MPLPFSLSLKKCSDIDLQICPDKCVSVVYFGSKFKKSCSFPIGGGHSRNLAHGAARFLGHTIAHSLSVQRKLSNNKISNRFLDMLEKVNKAPLRGKYKLWIYKRFVVPSFHFLLAVDLITKSTVSKFQGCAMKCIKSWLVSPCSGSYYQIHCLQVSGVCNEVYQKLAGFVQIHFYCCSPPPRCAWRPLPSRFPNQGQINFFGFHLIL